MNRFSSNSSLRRAWVLFLALGAAAFFGGCQGTPHADSPAKKTVVGPAQRVTAPPAAVVAVSAPAETVEVASPAPVENSGTIQASLLERPEAKAPAKTASSAPGELIDMRVALDGLSDFEMVVESEPSGAQVVVDGMPLAKTPCRMLLNGSTTGFCLEAFSVKARFIASDAGVKSQTVEELFTKHDRIPAKLKFTMAGATRTLSNEVK